MFIFVNHMNVLSLEQICSQSSHNTRAGDSERHKGTSDKWACRPQFVKESITALPFTLLLLSSHKTIYAPAAFVEDFHNSEIISIVGF